MNKSFLAIVLCLVWTGSAWGHGDISKLPSSVQIMQYRLGLYMSPDDLAIRNKLAMALYRTNQLGEAEEELKHIIAKDPMNFDALDGLGIVLIKVGRDAEALEQLNKAVKINEEDVMVHVHLSVVYSEMGSLDNARSELERAKSLVSDPAELEAIESERKLVSGP
ncbi:MAG: tetratricopeptide repeat protein [Thermodesulfobacteriota bacterium]|nr:tetratricopeptide repeat protein [Thermodesulfobacteriota bacterium]